MQNADRNRPEFTAQPSSHRRGHKLCAALIGVAATAAVADDGASQGPTLERVFVQIGFGDDTRMVVVGAARNWSWQLDLAGGVATGYWEASFGRWFTHLPDNLQASAWVTQVGVTPVLRWQARGSSWFVEGAIGANLLLPVYRSRDKRFSTTFNFGDHVAIGAVFGEWRQHEVALRLQHFSNAGISQPNPGQNFVQLRYSWRYDGRVTSR